MQKDEHEDLITSQRLTLLGTFKTQIFKFHSLILTLGRLYVLSHEIHFLKISMRSTNRQERLFSMSYS